ncbi:MAG: deoxyribose-phosphate aldolase [Solirubrobacteraceae bacterium]
MSSDREVAPSPAPSGAQTGSLPTVAQVAKMIDHSLLRPELTPREVREGCDRASQYGVMSVCARPSDVAYARSWLAGTGVLLGTVVGFPHGSVTTATKVAEARELVQAGAQELDMVVHIGRVRSGETAYVGDEIAAVVQAAEGRIVKVILENAYLDDDHKVTACRLAEAAGAHFVKTSTGFGPSGATLADVALMRSAVSERVQIKAAGGVRTLDALLQFRDAGVTRFGVTATAAILDELAARHRSG